MFNRYSAVPGDFIARDSRRLRPLAYIFLFLLCMAFFVPGTATLPPTDRDESSFAQATKQMIETGNYADIRLQAKPRYKKPVGIYWLQAISVKLFNPNHLNEIWAYRIPSLIGATVAVFMTAELGGLLFGPVAGLMAAIMLACCVLLNIEAHIAKTDAALLACVMVAQFALAKAYMETRNGWATFLLFWTAIGAGILIKGPIILLVVASTLLWLRWTDKNLGWFRQLKPLLGIPYALLLVAPWLITVLMLSHGQFLQQSVGHDMLGKVLHGQDRGKLPPGLYVLFFPLTFFPFSLVAMLAIPDVWKNRNVKAVKFCLGWIVPTWILFELMLTKLPHYVLPVYPAIALLAAKFLCDGFPVLAKKNVRWYLATTAAVWLIIGAAIAIGTAILPEILNKAPNVYAIAAGMTLIIAQGISLMMLPRYTVGSMTPMMLGALVFAALTFGSTLPGLDQVWMSREIMAKAEAIKPCEQVKIVSSGFEEPSLPFLAGTDTKLVLPGHSVAYEMQHDPCLIGIVDNDHIAEFLYSFPDYPVQPYPAETLRGFDVGHGDWRELTFYLLPHSPEIKNVQP